MAVISKDREVRMQSIAEELSKGHYDIVALQEVGILITWENDDVKKMNLFIKFDNNQNN